jgi:hypothetical protein
MEVWDSPNSAGVVIDAVRCCKLALDNGISGAIFEPSSYFMKSPPIQYTDGEARQMTEEYIAKHGWQQKGARKTKVRAAAKKPTTAKPAVKKTAKKTTRRSSRAKTSRSKRVVKSKK